MFDIIQEMKEDYYRYKDIYNYLKDQRHRRLLKIKKVKRNRDLFLEDIDNILHEIEQELSMLDYQLKLCKSIMRRYKNILETKCIGVSL